MPVPATARRHHVPAPLADAASPLFPGSETRVRILALLLGLSAGILLLPALLLALVATLATPRRRPAAPGLWYVTQVEQDDIAALSPRARRAMRRLLAIIGWAMAGHRNRGMRPRGRITGEAAPGLRPICAARAPPCPA